ncbi:MAG: methionyl-tRNA formyltransferase [Firmicutes bacterium]|nr:methionyl-tRNA formyltransferase [Bacillota bacterium]
MNIVFFGTSEFAINSLEALNKSKHKILCVVTQPDSKRDRGHKLHFSKVKEKAIELGLNIYQTENINDDQSEKFLKSLNADIFIVISFGALLKNNILKLSKYKAINVHPSILPYYRGAAPIQRTIMNGEISTGVTIMEMTDRLDAGDIILQKVRDIENNWNYGDLTEILSKDGAILLLEAIDLIEKGKEHKVVQNEELHTYAKKIKNEEKYLNLKADSIELVNTIRGLTPKITPLLVFHNHLLGIIDVEEGVDSYTSGVVGEVVEIDKKQGILVKCGKGTIWIKKLKPEGKNAMSFKDFINGNKINVGDILINKEEI